MCLRASFSSAAIGGCAGDNPGDTVEVHLFGHNQFVLLNPAEMSKRLLSLIAAAIAGAWGWS